MIACESHLHEISHREGEAPAELTLILLGGSLALGW
jgi:hypothetical protein